MAADREGRIQAIDTTSYVDAGCSEDFSGFIAGEMLENIEGVYQTPHCESQLPLEFSSGYAADFFPLATQTAPRFICFAPTLPPILPSAGPACSRPSR